MTDKGRGRFEACAPPANIKLALLWASLMFLYIYNDYFSLYVPGTVESMAKGSLGPVGQATGAVLAALSVLLAVPSLMIFLSAALPAGLSRWLNVTLGVIYTAIEGLTLFGAPLFYKMTVIAEMAVTATIIWTALRWPRRAPEFTGRPPAG